MACGLAGKTDSYWGGGLVLGVIAAGIVFRDDRPDWKAVEARAAADERAKLSSLISLVTGKSSEATAYIKAAPPLTMPSESLLLVVPTSLWRRENVGYELNSSTLGVNAAKPDAAGSITLGASASVSKGIAQIIDGFICVDVGRLALTNKRLLYIGKSRAAVVDLGRVIAVEAVRGLVDVVHPERQHQERFSVENADLIAYLIDVAAQRCQLS